MTSCGGFKFRIFGMVISGFGGSTGRSRRPVLFSLGFRPFYLLAAGLAVSWIPLWIGIWHLDLPGRFAPSAWHAHEMLFGFTSAVELAEGVTMASVHAPADVPVSRGPLPHGRTA